MQFSTVDWHPARRHLRQFAWLTALFLAVLSWSGDTSSGMWPLRLAAAFIFAVGTVLPGVLRWPYVALFLVLYLVAWLFQRTLQAASPSTVSRQPPGRGPERFQEHHERQPATRTHG